MPAAVATPKNHDRRPAKKPKLAQSSATVRQNGLKALVNGNAAKPTAKTSGSKNARADRVDDATAVVEGPADAHMLDADVIEISSAEEESEDDSESEQEDPTPNGAAADDDNAAEPEELTFGDRLRAEGPEPVQESRIISVEDAFDPNPERTVTTTKNRPLAPPNANSLGTVLTQALRTNDK